MSKLKITNKGGMMVIHTYFDIGDKIWVIDSELSYGDNVIERVQSSVYEGTIVAILYDHNGVSYDVRLNIGNSPCNLYPESDVFLTKDRALSNSLSRQVEVLESQLSDCNNLPTN
jgi:hypothetical protein